MSPDNLSPLSPVNGVARYLEPELAEFAKELLAAGFTVTLHASEVERVARGGLESATKSFMFSRVVDGQECVGFVQRDLLSYGFNMPIKPSRQNGSGMFVDGVEKWPGGSEKLTVANATKVASPFNSNPLVGRQANYYKPLPFMKYVEVAS